MTRIFSKLKALDFYKKLPSDLVEATLAGAWISIAAAIIMVGGSVHAPSQENDLNLSQDRCACVINFSS